MKVGAVCFSEPIYSFLQTFVFQKCKCIFYQRYVIFLYILQELPFYIIFLQIYIFVLVIAYYCNPLPKIRVSMGLSNTKAGQFGNVGQQVLLHAAPIVEMQYERAYTHRAPSKRSQMEQCLVHQHQLRALDGAIISAPSPGAATGGEA